ncbi:hypothetical protein BT67DRAFT_155656 [Trichocladium antarcticum]|uniref:Uncharacterized protein n=1 Tax=Trichocladium antarcticum TaxID=1450529 RepID=A0AAN6ZA29_9PEZI|nr:hypothetical protein BT67DRAFT_155656 [Trichocladium antarcticum]
MAQPPSFSSNNPFRRKPSVPPVRSALPPFPAAEASTPTVAPTLENAPALPSGDRFRSHLQALSHLTQPPPATSFQKPKVVKKVRVQSPPPSSPESAGAPDRHPAASYDDDDESSSSLDTDDQLEPFGYASSADFHGPGRGVETQPPRSHPPPPNPFQKTLHDLEAGLIEPPQATATAAPGTRNTMDVDAFRRLLLTGEAGGSGPSQTQGPPHTTTPPAPTGDAASTVDTSSTSSQSIRNTIQPAQETPRNSHEAFGHDLEEGHRPVSTSRTSLQPAPTILRKKPPPPSSRHGKLIKAGPGAIANGAPSVPRPSSPTRSASAPLACPSIPRPSSPSVPADPQRLHGGEDAESVFDREAAGTVPEPPIQPGLNIIMPPQPPTPPTVSHATPNFPVTTRKPAPPPRRQPHGRSESKITPSVAHSLRQDDTDSSVRRSSIDSTPSRSSSLRVSVHAPAPPPPRRPSHHARASSTLASPGVASPGSEESPSATIEQAVLPGVPLVASPSPLGDTPTTTSTASSIRDIPATVPRLPPTNRRPSTPNYHPHPQPQPHPPLQQQPLATTTTTTTHIHPKLFPPPPPPTRNPSTRAKKPRPASLLSRRESASQNHSGTSLPPQPPPPPRRRESGGGGGGARGSMDGGGRSGSGSGRPDGGVSVAGVQVEMEMEGAAAAEDGGLLADLGALQREVDALRGRFGT